MDDYRGEEFLNKNNPNLHMSEEAMRTSIRSDTPSEKIRRYLERIERITKKTNDKSRETHDQDNRRLRSLYYRRYIIKREDVPDSYFELQQKIALERGYGNLRYDEESKQMEIDQIQTDQKQSLDNWLDYFDSEEASMYPMWFKYYAFQGMVKLGAYDKGKGTYSRRTSKTVKPFVELNREALAIVYHELSSYLSREEITDESLKRLLDGGNFGKLYAYAIKKLDSSQKNERKNDEGIWVKYEHGSDASILFNDLRGKGTGWCTAGALSVAEQQLAMGDFYVYYTKDIFGNFTCPRIAIRKEGRKIAEIRGVAPQQNIEHNMERVVEEKLKEADFPDRDIYRQKVEDMQMMTYIHTKWKNSGQLDVSDLRFLYEIDKKIIGFGYERDPRIEEIISTRNIKKDLALITGYKESEISTNSRTALRTTTKLHYGMLILPKTAKNASIPQIIGGEVDFSMVEILENFDFNGYLRTDVGLHCVRIAKNVKFPEGILTISMAALEEFENLTFPSSLKKIQLESLKSVKGLNFPNGLEKLLLNSVEDVDGLVLPDSLKQLSLIKAKSIDGLTFPDTLEILHLSSSDVIKGINFPSNLKALSVQTLGDIKGLVFPENLKTLNIMSSNNNKDLVFPSNLNALYIDGLIDAEGLNLPESLKIISFPSLKTIKGLTLPKELEEINLGRVTNVDGLVLPMTLKKATFDEVESINGMTFPSEMKLLDLGKLKKATNLVLPQKVDYLDLSSLTDAEELVLPSEVKTLYLSPSLDVSKIRVPEDAKTREILLEALKDGLTEQNMREEKKQEMIRALEEHFRGNDKKKSSVKNISIKTNPPKKVLSTALPKVAKIATTTLTRIKKRVGIITDKTLTYAKASYIRIKDRLKNLNNNTQQTENNHSHNKK